MKVSEACILCECVTDVPSLNLCCHRHEYVIYLLGIRYYADAFRKRNATEKRMNIKEGIPNMALLEQWRNVAYDENADKNKLQQLWSAYFQEEKEIYAQLLKNPDEEVKGTVKELADKYGVSVMTMTGFLDGIDESLVTPNPIEEMEEDTVVSLGFDKEKLYKNMVAAEADWLYNLEEWNSIFDEDKRKALYKEQKASTTVVKEAKIYPNDPCPCGSGKKYKKCCGKK